MAALVLVAGFGSNEALASSLTWSDRTPMPTARDGLVAVTADNGKIYALGGQGSQFVDDQLATVEAYDPALDSWVTKSPMQTIRLVFGAVNYNGKVYVFGGQGAPSGPFALSSVEQYDPATDTWTYKASMPVALAGTKESIHGLTPVEGALRCDRFW